MRRLFLFAALAAALLLVPACQMPGGAATVTPSVQGAQTAETQGQNPHTATAPANMPWYMGSNAASEAMLKVFDALGESMKGWTAEQVIAFVGAFKGLGAPQTVTVEVQGDIRNGGSAETGGAAIGRSSLPTPGSLGGGE